MEAALCKGAVSSCVKSLLALFGPVRPPQGGKKKGEPMKKKTILFDLDGTLLPMDQDAFTRGYFKLLAQKLAPHGYDPAALVDNIWAGTAAMVGNDGKRTNEAAFWDRFAALYGEQVREDIPLFDAFYRQEFQQAKAFCGFTPKARAAVEACKAAGHRVALATNPIFPAVATESRIRWAGLAPETFAWYTTYENIGYCKPNPDYYREILRYLGCRAEDCLMVGNDVEEDMMAAQAAGLSVFLLTDCLLNRKEKDISSYPQGDFDALLAFVEEWGGAASL